MNRSREKLVTFGKLSVNFRKDLKTIDYYILNRIFYQLTFITNFPEHVLNISVRHKVLKVYIK